MALGLVAAWSAAVPVLAAAMTVLWGGPVSTPDPLSSAAAGARLAATLLALSAAAEGGSRLDKVLTDWRFVPVGAALMAEAEGIGLASQFLGMPLVVKVFVRDPTTVLGFACVLFGAFRWAEGGEVSGKGSVLPMAAAALYGLAAAAVLPFLGLERTQPVVPPAATLAASIGGPAVWVAAATLFRRGRGLPGLPTISGGIAFLSYSAVWAILRGSELGSLAADLLLRDIPVTASILMVSLGIVEMTSSTQEARVVRRGSLRKCRITLVEADPASDWISGVLEMIRETPDLRPVIFTRPGGRLDCLRALGIEGAVFVYLAEVRSPERPSRREFLIPMEESFAVNVLKTIKRGSGPIFLVFDNVTDLIIMLGTEEAYSFLRGVLSTLEERDEAAFILVPGAHPRQVVEAIRGMFQCSAELGAEASYSPGPGGGG